MFLNLYIQTLSMRSGWTDKSGERSIDPAIQMTLGMAGRDHLDLATGEVFRHPTRNFGNDTKPSIEASAYIRVSKDAATKSTMGYFEAHHSSDGVADSEASINFDLAIDDVAFEHLVANMRGGIFPTKMQIQFDRRLLDNGHPLEYGWEPDGSGMKWDNSTKEKAVVQIDGVSFTYDVLKRSGDADLLPNDRPAAALDEGDSSKEDTKALLAAVQEINVNLSRLIKVLVVVVATALGVSYRFW